MSWRVDFQLATGTSEWLAGLWRFDTRDGARTHAEKTMERWGLVRSYRLVQCDDAAHEPPKGADI